VTALLPPFTRQGTYLDVTVSSVGSATSLDGGTLLMTALRGPDGNVYAVAQGKIVTSRRGDFLARFDTNRRPTGQTLVTAQVPQGALLEKEVAFEFQKQKELKYQLQNPDFTTAARIARRINDELGGKYATAEDGGTVAVLMPYTFEGGVVDLVARIESLDVEQDTRAKVVINPRTGTIVMGEQVRVSPVAIAQGNLRVEIRDEERKANGPVGFDRREAHHVALLSKGTSVADIAASLNEIGASGDDLISLFQALKASGALVAELEIQ
jgi:flagellar P-ring protein precursor FlgI